MPRNPVAPADNELEIASGQRMEPVSYTDTLVTVTVQLTMGSKELVDSGARIVC